MARKPRLHVPGGIYHVLLRGNGGQDIFFAKQDRSRFLLLLQEGVERFDCRVHAFCLMTNHIHLIIQVGRLPLAKILHNLSFRYTRFINKRKNRLGHLFQGRYKAFLVDADSYLVELVRYMHNNPVRAKMVQTARAYSWSSHLAYLGLAELPWLTTEWVLGQFGEQLVSARKQYQDFIAQGAEEGQRADFYGGGKDSRVIGNDSFLETVLGEPGSMTTPALPTITGTVCRNYRVQLETLQGKSRARQLAEARGVICWLAQRLEAASVSELAALFNRDISTMSRASANIDRKRAEDVDFRKKVERFSHNLRN